MKALAAVLSSKWTSKVISDKSRKGVARASFELDGLGEKATIFVLNLTIKSCIKVNPQIIKNCSDDQSR